MRWKMKAQIQNVISLLPSSASYAAHYWLQRHVGKLRSIDPTGKFHTAIETWKHIRNLGYEPAGGAFFEVGTGWAPIVPLAFWLLGAKSTTTVDLNPYLKIELIREAAASIAGQRAKVEALFGELLVEDRLASLLALSANGQFTLADFCDHCGITYIAPGDAADTDLADGSIDFHTSHVVLKHIPPAVLKRIFEEGNRIVRSDGLFIHRIDYSDHFSHSDRSISAINFLQYSDIEWQGHVRDGFMYMNRLRHDDFLELFRSAGHQILLDCPGRDEEVSALLKAGKLRLADRFNEKPAEVLAIRNSWIASRAAPGAAL